MQLSKNKKHQYLFFIILSVYTIFNGGNSNILIQINFILTSLLFFFCLKDKNYKSWKEPPLIKPKTSYGQWVIDGEFPFSAT